MITEKQYIYDEKKLADEMGIPRKLLKEFRLEELGPDDSDRVSNRVCYSLMGLDRIRKKFAVGAAPTDPVRGETAGEKKNCGGARPAGVFDRNHPARAVVKVVFGVNTKILLAELLGEASERAESTEIRVRVLENFNFMPQMEIPVIPTPNPLIWELACRCPGRRGRLAYKWPSERPTSNIEH